MLGTELSLLLEKQCIPFIGTDSEVDITDPSALDNFAGKQKIDWVINCAAYTAVDKAEDDIDFCRRLNVEGAANVSACAKKNGAAVIHISTDYVFDGVGITDEGKRRPYTEDDDTNPIGVYGLSKRDGEIAVMQNNNGCYVIRTAWLYGKYGNNFVHTMLRFMNEREEVKVVDDQRGSPTWTFDLASVVLAVIKAGKEIPFGIYHFTNEGDISWYDFAKEIYRLDRENGLIETECTVKPCSSAEYPAKVTRPAYSVLDKSKIKNALGIKIPFWDESLREYLKTHA